MDSDDEEIPQLVEVEPAAAIPAVGYKIDGQDIPVCPKYYHLLFRVY